ncbi:integrase [Solwaraspora sp. WMMD792]|uniref:tyrosine-type recombinase/integrase n=1 Tax=Solwaraspora sp. WMMD792 TaxID=3016099 RepID=UPI0024160E13|nr:integrase [Solwaraspora sp. WMMD792]MDG4772829.1 integrase [Solwaraspora sp. WMMD792]
MSITYDVRVWSTEIYEGKRGRTYWVRWRVAGQPRKEPFKTKALAESYRSELVSAARKGEAFDVESGRPVSMRRQTETMSWYQLACSFADMKWLHVAATTRRTHAEALAALTVLMLSGTKGRPDGPLLRRALTRWAFNTARRGAEDTPDAVRQTLDWVKRNTRDVESLSRAEVLRPILDGLTVRLDGKPAAPSVVSRRRKIFNTVLEYAVESGLLEANPLPQLKWRPPKVVTTVDKRSVANPVQARTLLESVREQGRIGPRMVAFYACLYYAAMRPEEAVRLAKSNLRIPKEGWGEFILDGAEPHAGREWTDSGKNRDQRQLKQRARGESRTVPCPPELTAIINAHIDDFGFGANGRLFVSERNKEELPKGTINRVWRWARADVFTPEVHATPLARTPYDLRHAAVSTWLNGGVPSTQVAEWAGQSVEVLLRIYAKCLDGGEAALRQRIERALGHG